MALLGSGKPGRRVAAAPDSIEMNMDVFVAAALSLRGDQGGVYRTSLPAWQRQTFELYDLIGEAWYPVQFYARMLSRVRLFVGKRQPNGEVTEVDNEEAQRILARVRDPGGGQSEWKGQYGRLQFLVGDGTLVASLDDDGNERWEYLSIAEFVPGDKKNGRRTFTRKMPGDSDKELFEAADGEELAANTCRAWRLWNRHPLHSWLADSPMRATISQFQLLMLLDKAATAQALSRIVGAGLLVVDDSISIPAADSQAADESADDDQFMKMLTKYVVTPISDPGSAAGVAPLVARVTVPEGRRVEDLIKLIQLHDPNQTSDWHERIEKTIKRIAIGLDMPPEEFLGLAQANHWTGWVITEEKWKAHGEPVTIRLCEDLTSAYFRPACIDEKIEGAEDLIVWYDPAQVVTHPDRGKDAQAVFELGELSGDELRKANNFSKDAAPSPEERERFAQLRGRDRPDDPSEEGQPGTGADVPRGAPEQNGDRTGQPSPQPGNRDMSVIRGIAALAIERCREVAAARILSRKMSCDGCFDGMDKVPKNLLAARVGEEVVRKVLGFEDELALVRGGADLFVPTAMMYGMEEETAKRLAKMIERCAAESLYWDSPAALSFELSQEFKTEAV